MKSIAIDGPAGAGKSTIAKNVAAALGFIYVDTGALYRSIGLYALNNNINTKSTSDLEKILKNIEVEIVFLNDKQHIFLNTEDVTDLIRTPAVSMAASDVSAIPCVREFLFNLQKDLARKNNVVMDGRDIGTVVLPNADVKIFLTACAQERARRRFEELCEKGSTVSYEEVLKDVETRDHNDSTREIAPLKPAEDSIIIDTTGNSLEQSIQLLIDTVKNNLK
ncbi:MAG: (d)CMP kinase [Clostridia bacterium]